MKITVPGDALRAALARCTKIADGRLIPIFGHVHVAAADDEVRVSAYSSEVTLTVALEAAVTTPGEACIPAAELHALAAAAGKQPVNIDHVLASAFVTFGRTKAELHTLPPIDWPMTARPEIAMTAPPEGFAAALRFAAAAASKEETRFYLKGVYVDQGEHTTLVSTDGHRMHTAELPRVAIDSAIIPDRQIELIASLADIDGFRIGLTEREWCAEAGGVRARGATVDGSFPDWRRVQPLDPQPVATIDATALLAAISVATAGSEKLHRHVGLTLRDGAMALRGARPGAALSGGIATEIDAETVGAFRSGFNADYLVALVKGLGCEVLTLSASGFDGPHQFFIAEPLPANGMRGFVSPMRFTEAALPEAIAAE